MEVKERVERERERGYRHKLLDLIARFDQIVTKLLDLIAKERQRQQQLTHSVDSKLWRRLVV